MLAAGNYRLENYVTKEYIDRPFVQLSSSLTAHIVTAAGIVTKLGPGLRLRQLAKHFGNGQTEIQNYEYSDPATGKTSGILGNFPNYLTTKTNTYFNQVTGNGYYVYTCTFNEFTAASHYPLINSKGSYIGYSFVTESSDNAKSQGKTTHTFTNFDLFNDINNVTNFPYAPTSSQQWKRGLPLTQQQWLREPQPSGAVFSKRQTDSLTYAVLTNSVIRAYGIKVARNGTSELATTDDALLASLAVDQYPLESDSYQLQSKTTAMLDRNLPWSTQTTYGYSPQTYQLRRIITANSNGVITAQRLSYPTDFLVTAGSPSLLIGLQAAHRVNVPIEQTSIRLGINQRLLSGIVHEYGLSSTTSGRQQYFLQKIHAANVASADTVARYDLATVPSFYEEQARVTNVNSHGQPTVQNEKGRVRSFHWDNDDRYVVAACVNATDVEFYFEGFEASTTSGGSAPHSGFKYHDGPYTVNWTRPNSRAYRVSYWARQSTGTWQYHQTDYTGPSMVLTGGNAYDDVRVCPADALLTTYTYEPLVGVTSQTDPASRTTRYEYDGLGRLVCVRDEQGRVLTAQQYHYARP